MTRQQRRVGAYAKLLANYASDDAIIAAGEAAELLFVRALAFCATSDSDGYMTDAQVQRFVGAGMRDAFKRADRLVEVGLWDKTDGGYVVRSWTKIHETSEEKGRVRKSDRERKAAARGHGEPVPAESGRIPDGQQRDSAPESLSLIHNSALQSSTSIATAAPSRRKDELWEAVIEACGVDSSSITAVARGGFNRAVKELRDAGATPGMVKVRAQRYRRQWPETTLTPMALAKQWPQLANDAHPAGAAVTPW